MGGGRRGAGGKQAGGGVKDRRPVLLPNDGTIHRRWKKEGLLDHSSGEQSADGRLRSPRSDATPTLEGGDDDATDDDSSRLFRCAQQEAICLLQVASSRHPLGPQKKDAGCDEDRREDDVDTRHGVDANQNAGEDDEGSAIRLVRSLLGASSLPEQLQILQAFRSRGLTKRRLRDGDGNGNGGGSFFVALYCLLLEWYLSPGTPVPLKRAVLGVLSALDRHWTSHQPRASDQEGRTETSSVCWRALVRGVVASLVGDSYPTDSPPPPHEGASSSAWTDPRHTARELLEYVSSRRHGDDSGAAEGADLARLVVPLWTCLERWSRPVQQQISATVPTDSAALTAPTTTWDGDLLRAIDEGIELCQLCQQLVGCAAIQEVGGNTSHTPDSVVPDAVTTAVNQLVYLHWSILTCPALPLDKLLLVGIATVRIELFRDRFTEAPLPNPKKSLDLPRNISCLHLLVRAGLTRDVTEVGIGAPSPQVQVALLNGIATGYSSLNLFVAIQCEPEDVEQGESDGRGVRAVRLADRILHLLCQSTQVPDVDVRFLAFKGLRTLTNRYAKLEEETGMGCEGVGLDVAERIHFQDRVLSVVLDAWENPSGSRKVETAILPLFCQLLAFRSSVDANVSNVTDVQESSSNESSARLVQRILDQPKHSKGRYLALHALLKMPTNRRMASQLFSRELCEDLLSGIGEGGHNTLVMADLLSLLLRQLLDDLRGSAGVDTQDAAMLESGGLRMLNSWLDCWIPSFVASLLSSDGSSRRHIASFCFPRIVESVGGVAHRPAAALTMDRILSECHGIEEGGKSGTTYRSSFAPASCDESLVDRALWVQLKAACFAFQEGLFKDADLGSPAYQLTEALASSLPIQRVQLALVHFSAPIRDAAFEAIEAVAFCASHSERDDNSKLALQLRIESDLWTFALPYSQKLCGKESTTIILHRLLAFIDRLSRHAETHTPLLSPDCKSSEEPLVLAFSSFLLSDLFVKRGCYPGSTLEKELFSLGIIESLMVYLFRNDSVARVSKLIPKTGTLFQRRRGSVETALLLSVGEDLMSDSVFCALVSLMHSIWDNTRSSAFEILANAIVIRRKATRDLPSVLSNELSFHEMEIRSIHLASSPRQREADSGSRLLAILFLASKDQESFLSRMLALLESRLFSVAEMLRTILNGNTDAAAKLPLAHGIIHAIRLILSECSAYGQPCDDQQARRLVELVFRGLRLSLTVVADLRKSGPDGLDEDCQLADDCIGNESRPISAGAIGANLAFSSVQHASDRDVARRLAYQRLIVGAWLLTKESCRAISTVFSAKESFATHPLLTEAGDLLLKTLATLKHAGAVYGSHKSLQDLSVLCLGHATSAIEGLPSAWVTQLLGDVEGIDGAKSILRRSTGLSLGFLSIMRSEAATRVSPRPLCRRVIMSLLRFTLPPHVQLQAMLTTISFKPKDLGILFYFLAGDASLVSNPDRDAASRVHAFNVLRAAFLDSPLAPDVFPYAGDAIAAAVLGYLDPLWAVRNSATMLYSSVMLRVIDSNKNAWDVKGTTSRAITLSELFRSFPALPRFLSLMLNAAASRRLLSYHAAQSIPPELPILLLFCRVQPVTSSGTEAEAILELLWPSILTSLRHRSILVRRTAARALSNLAFDRDQSTKYSSRKLASWCLETYDHAGDWNYAHGIMLTLLHVLLDKKKSKIDEGMRRRVHKFLASFFNQPLEKLPPPCLSVALSISLVSDFNGLLVAAFRIQRLVEEMNQHRVNGMAGLGSAVGSAATMHLSLRMWSSDASAADFLALLELQSTVFNSSAFDIRLTAVKVFKKDFYRRVETIHERPPADARLMFDAVVSVLSRSLIRELHSCAMIGSHVPTLRRLSRCLIEASIVLLKARSDHDDKSNGRDEVVRAIIPFLKQYRRESGAATSDANLTGNLLELFALALGRRTDVDTDKIALLKDFVVCFSDPSQPWRLRHSAAAALQMSHVLGRPQDLPKKDHQIFLQLAVQLSQDNDVDVRRTAALTLLSAAPSSPAPVDVPFQTTPLVPEHVFQTIELSKVALQFACEFTNGVESGLSQAIDELQSLMMALRSCGSSDLSDLSNASSDRLIFEEEALSRYMEPCLLVQRSLSDLVQQSHRRTSQEPWTSQDIDLASTIVRRCYQALLGLVDFYRRHGSGSDSGHRLLYDVTQESTVMPPLHCLLLASAAVFLVGLFNDTAADVFSSASEQSQLKPLVQELLDLSMSSLPLHPLVDEALRLVATPDSESPLEDDAHIRFRRACFLLS